MEFLNFRNGLIWLICLASIGCMLARPRNIGEAWWACTGALILVAFSLISPLSAKVAVLRGVDVYLFLAGMMILSELAREEGVFDWIAEIAADHAGTSAKRLFLLIYLAGTVVTIFLSNDATAVVLTPAVLTIVRRLKVEPAPHLLGCALIANAASFVLPISNPANLVMFGKNMPPLAEWVRTFILSSIVSVLVTYIALRMLTGKVLEKNITETLHKNNLSPEGRMALFGLCIAAAALVTAAILNWQLGAATCVAAVFATLLVTSRNRSVAVKVTKGVAWSVIPLVAGLFVMMEALQEAGMLKLAEQGITFVSRRGEMAGNLIAAFAVGLASNGINNLPVGLIASNALQVTNAPKHIVNAALVGVDLGPNLSVTGSLATILWLIALRRDGVKITGWQFFKVGAVVMPLSLLGSILVLRR